MNENLVITDNIKAHFLRLYQMAICDDSFSSLELKTLYKLAEDKGVSQKSLDEILKNPVSSKISIPPKTLEQKVDDLYDLTVMIWADGEVTPNEKSLLEKYVIMFGFMEENTSQIVEYLIEFVKAGKTRNDIINDLKD